MPVACEAFDDFPPGPPRTAARHWRIIHRMTATADLVGLPDDPDFRAAFVSYLEWGTRIAVFNSQPGVEPIQHAPVPRWSWGQSPPFVPFPWDDHEAADRGRARYAAGEDPTPGLPDLPTADHLDNQPAPTTK